MTELIPLLQASENERTRALLRAGQGDVPNEGYSERLLLGLGIGAAVSTVSVTASAGAAGAVVKGTASLGGGAVSLAAVAAKWVAVGVLGGGILAGGVDLAVSPHATPVEPARVVHKSNAQPRLPRAPVVAPLPVAAPEPEPEAEPPAEPKATKQASSAPPGDDGQLAREVQAVDVARRAIAAGDLQKALTELDRFDGMATTGVLDREVRILRIETLYKAGQAARARALSQQYLERYPNDAHAARLRALDQAAPAE